MFLLTLALLSGHVHGQKPPAKPRRDPRGAKTLVDSSADRRLEFGATLGGQLSGGERHRYLIQAPAGNYLKIVVAQQGIDVEVALLTAGGEVLVRVDNANGTRGAETVSLVTEADADFRVEVRAKEPKPKPAPYAVSIAEQRVSTEDDGKRVRAERALASGESLRAEGTLDSYRQALARYEEAYRLWRGLDAPQEATALLDMGKAHYFLLNMEEAVGKYAEALKIFEESRLTLDEGVARLYIGMAKLALGDNAEALKYYGRALELFNDSEDGRYVSFALNETGRAYYLRGDANLALEYYARALPIRHALNDRKGESFTLVSMGRAYSNGFGDDARALDLYQQALGIQRELNNRRLIAQTLGDIGRIHYKAGDYAAALGHYNDALHAAENGDPSVRAEILMYIGLVYSAWGRHREAVEQYFGEALRLQEGRDPVGRARTLQHMGRSYAALGDDVNALDNLNHALGVWRKVLHRTAEAETRYQIAAVESRRGRYAEACEQIRAALPVVETLRTGIVNRALRAHYFASAQNYYELYIDALMRLSRQTNNRELEAVALSISESKRARALLDLLGEAKADVRRTVSDPELLNREAAIQQELSAISLRQVTGEHVTPEQVRRIERLIAQLYEVDSEIRKKDPRYAALTRPSPPSLEQIQKGLLARDQMLLEYSLGDERSYLWAVTQTSAKSYVLRGRAEIEAAAERFMKSLTSRNVVVEGETEEARDARVGRADAEYRDAASSLGTMLGLDKATSETKAERLLLVADGELQYLPFSALLVPSRGEQRRDAPTIRPPFDAWDKSAPLVAYYEIEEPPSMAVVAELRRGHAGPPKPVPERTIAVIADPVFSTADDRCCKPARGGAVKKVTSRRLPSGSTGVPLSLVGGNRTMAREAGITDGRGRIARLGFTRLEADEILALVPPSEQLKATGFEANLALLTDGSKLSAYRIMHLATHGLLNSEHPELSGILLSLVDERGRQQNGFLQLHQIYNLRLPAEMVVLSACETGVGQRTRGEGLNGISRGFMYAGARRVVASLWKVNDDSTSQLMKYFYQGLRLGENPDLKRTRPAAALRAAQLEMMRHRIWRHPYFWAAFVVQGEAD
ncbi:MAG TPA: CHAT domain-containing tetratricopeptide repeat protein [Pyrinomonadaceae bacterium]